jgi:hypothetical protein
MLGWVVDDRGICAILMAACGLLLAMQNRLRPRRARAAWAILLAAGVANALVLDLLPANLVNINTVHHYLGAKYVFAYDSFYSLIDAAIERPQVAMRDLERPPAMRRQDRREQRGYYVDLLRQEGVEFDPLASLPELRAQVEASGALGREAERILREGLPADHVEGFRRDVRLALLVERAERNIEDEGRDITWDYGFNGSPFYALARQIDPTLHRSFGRGTAWLNLAWQIAAALVMVWLTGKALDLDAGGRMAMAALLFASWDFVGWALPGMIFGEMWLAIAVALLALRRRRSALAGVAIAWAGLVKLFPFILVLPFVARSIATLGGSHGARLGVVHGTARNVLAWCAGTAAILGFLSALGGRSWTDFLQKVVAQFLSEGYLLNSVSLSQALFALGIHGSPLPAIFSLASLAALGAMFLRGGDENFFASLPRQSLVLLGATGWLVHTWFDYYAIAPLLLLPVVAQRHRIGAALAAGAMSLAFLLPEFEDPMLLAHPILHLLKIAPYVAIPAWLVALEFHGPRSTLGARRAVALAVSLAVLATASEALRLRTIRRLDEAANACLDRTDFRGALACRRRAATLAPRNAMARMNEAIALAYAGQDRDAGAGFARAACMDPGSAVIRQNHGRWLLRIGLLDEAAAEFEAARAVAPHDDTILFDLARTRLRQGRRGDAIALLARARELYPENQQVIDLLKEIDVPDPNP